MNILVIEDNKKLAENICDVLRLEEYNAVYAQLGSEGIEKASLEDYDLIILDLTLPDIDGIEVCKELREQKNYKGGILMLTARIDLDSKIEGLDTGADDYLTKPFDVDELTARVRAILRRKNNAKSTKIMLNNNVKIDTKAKKVYQNDKIVDLSPLEYKLLECLSLNMNKALNSVELYNSVWGEDSDDLIFSDSLKVHVANLRKKLGKDVIDTVRGHGYIISSSED